MDVSTIHCVNEKRVFEKISKLAKEHMLKSNNLMLRKGDTLYAFKVYAINKRADGLVDVDKNDKLCFTTDTLQYALAWCIADKYQAYRLQEDIVHYARLIELRKADITHYKEILRSADKENVVVYLNRLEDAIIQMSLYKKQISKCIKIAKYRQQKGFDNETSRIGLDSVRKFTKDFRKSF